MKLHTSACVALSVALVLGGFWAVLEARAEEPAADAPWTIERVATGYRFTEGPAQDAEGRILFTDIHAAEIHRFDPKTGKAERFLEKSGRSNGLLFDAKGRLLACEGGRRQLVRHDGEGKVTVLASRYEGKRLNSPNDLTRDDAGRIWFTDPRYGKQDDRELDFEGVYLIDGDKPLRRVCSEVEKPNGILRAKKGKRLYVADSKRKRIMVYDVGAEGIPAKGRVFANLELEGRGGPDGMTQDDAGHVFVSGQGHLWMWDAKGTLVHKVRIPESPTNCLFVSAKPYTLYVTARTSLYRLTKKAK